MLNFSTLKWKNLLSTGNYWTEIKLNKTQNTLVVGENGSGKSTMLDALCFVLYNKPFREINRPALVNTINQKETQVEVEFRTENHGFKVVRGIKPNVFEIYQDGILLNQDAEARDYQKFLEEFVLKLNYKSFTQIVILGSASFTPFMQLDAKDRRAIIEDLLDIQIFSLMNGLVKTRLSTIQGQRTENKLLIEGSTEKIQMQERYMSEVKQDTMKVVSEYAKEQENNVKEIARLNMEVAISRRAIADMSAKITEKSKVETALKKVTQLEAQIENVVAKHKKNVKFFETEDQCPTCTQDIEEAFKATQIKELSIKVSDCESGLAQLEQKFLGYQKQMSEIAAIEQEMVAHEVGISGHLNSISQIEKFNTKIEEKIAGMMDNHQSTEREESRLLEQRQELVRLEDAKKVLIEAGSYYDAASLLLKDTGIKTKIIRQYLPIINTLCNKFLANLDFFVNFNLDETFKETIKSRYRDEFTYHSFSEGEKQRIDMALMLTWRAVAKLKNSADTNLLILDEIFDSSLDNTGAEELMKILHSLEATNVFVISHRGDILQDKFRSVVKFSTQQNFSRIVD